MSIKNLFTLLPLSLFLLGCNSEEGNQCEPCGYNCCPFGSDCLSGRCCDWVEIEGAEGVVWDIWGTSATNIYAVFTFNNLSTGEKGSGILHYDGIRFEEVYRIQDLYLSDVWGSSATDVFVGGGDVDTQESGIVLHYDGIEWERMQVTADFIEDIWGTSSTNVYAVSTNWNAESRRATIIHYNGENWSKVVAIDGVILRNVLGFSEADIYATGSISLHFNGTDWKYMSMGDAELLQDIWGSSNDNFFAVGNRKDILRHDGTFWKKVRTSEHDLFGVWGSSPSNVFFTGENGTIIHYDGTNWKELAHDLDGLLIDAWGFSADEIYIVGDGLVLRCEVQL